MSLARFARPIHGEDELEQLLDLVGHARLVVLGASSYGTHEHFDLRASLTRKLLGERGFAAVAIEADWHDALRVDRYVRNHSDDDGAAAALSSFGHFPAWAWRNDDVARFVDWLRIHNCVLPAPARAGFYGLDRYPLNAALRALRTHGDVADDELIAELVDMQWRHAARSGRTPSGNAWLHAIAGGGSVHDVATYFRTMLAGGLDAWALRSTQLADTVDMLARELGRGEPAKLVVWAHDAHAGDARAIAGAARSLGHCLRERHPDEIALVGFTTYEGTVRAASAWDAPDQVEVLAPASAQSWEALFHATAVPRFMITASALRRALGDQTRLRRTVGAIVRDDPHVATRLAAQFDVVVHVDVTRAVTPLLTASSADDTHVIADVRACAE